MAVLSAYRTEVGAILATAVDASTWTTAIIDQALRMGLSELNDQLVYETSFTVTSTGYQQDLSGITAINRLLALAYPWEDGYEFGHCIVPWRLVGNNIAYFTGAEPTENEVIRVRHSKLHVIQDLDAAVATTVPDQQQGLVTLWAAAYACDLRVRQVSENPALPRETANVLRGVAVIFRQRATNMLSHVPPLGRLRWGSIGME